MLKTFLFFATLIVFLNINLYKCDENVEESTDDEPSLVEEPKPKPKYVKPVPRGSHHFIETFDIDTIGKKWIKSLAKKDGVDELISRYEGQWSIETAIDSALDGDKGLVLKSKAKHHAISARLLKPFDFRNTKPLIIQYEVKFQTTLECGGAYVKLLTDNSDLVLEQFTDKTPYTIMFGPDKCGNDHKLHFILRHKHPKTGVFEEKHAKKVENIDSYFSDGKTHLYTLILRPNNRYQLFVDEIEVGSGSLLTDLTPPINPEKEIIDPNDQKPDNWDERAKIPDPDAQKPDDWDENEPKKIPDPQAKKPEGWLDDEESTIPDLDSKKPEDWDDDTDGEWEAPKVNNPKCENAPGCGVWEPPMIDNPKYKGKWKAPLIDNPNYQGKWEPRRIPNPDYFEDTDPFKSIVSFSAIGLELWSMTENIYFDNFLITDDEKVAHDFAKDSWAQKRQEEVKGSKSSESVVDSIINPTRERPWLWGVYVLVVLVPIVLIFVFCCSGKSSSSATTMTISDEERKKTDAPSKDDDENENEDDENEIRESSRTAAQQVEQNENNENGDSNNEENEDEDNNTDNKETKLSGSRSSLNKVDSNEEETKLLHKSPRQRRPRKD